MGAAESSGRPHWTLLVVPIGIVSTLGLIGTVLTPPLAARHPLLLLALEARDRNLLLARHVGVVPYVLVGNARSASSSLRQAEYGVERAPPEQGQTAILMRDDGFELGHLRPQGGDVRPARRHALIALLPAEVKGAARGHTTRATSRRSVRRARSV